MTKRSIRYSPRPGSPLWDYCNPKPAPITSSLTELKAGYSYTITTEQLASMSGVMKSLGATITPNLVNDWLINQQLDTYTYRPGRSNHAWTSYEDLIPNDRIPPNEVWLMNPNPEDT